MPTCLGHEILFNTNCDTNQTYFHWDFGDGHSATGPIVRHTYAAPGCYTVQTIIDYANTPLSDHSRDTLIGSITISPRDTVTYYDSCCIFPYQWDDTLISSPGAHLRYSNNIGNTLTLVDAMRDHGCKSIIFSSSATVYGDPDALPLTEESPKKPATNPYGWTRPPSTATRTRCP